MTALRLSPVLLSCWLLAAHFHRSGPTLLALGCLLLPLLLAPRRAWVPRAFSALLLLGSLEWFRTLYVLTAQRMAFDQPWGRLALILGAVALFTAASALVFRLPEVRRRYDRGDRGSAH